LGTNLEPTGLKMATLGHKPRPKRGVGAFADGFSVLRELNRHDRKRGGSRLHARKVRGKWPHNAHQRRGIAGRRLRRKTGND
jgi:hypothetical protein